ncbi:MAG: nucleotide pyrophosphatase/phosphodiesterase family protein [Planctomycetota bacterium]
MTPLLVLNVVGLTRALMRKYPASCKNMSALANDGSSTLLGTVLPAVTCTVQSTFLTGLAPRDHGIVANGWYFRDLAEVHFWKQSNALVHGSKIWHDAKKRNSSFTSAQLFWWYNMYSKNDVAVTPRPAHLADGSLISLTYTNPPELAPQLDAELGRFPLFEFWGPGAGIGSSLWIERCAGAVAKRFSPTLTLVYLPHLDYNLQRLGPDDPRIAEDLKAVDVIAGRMIDSARARGAKVVILSEYGMSQTTGAVDINRVLRRGGFLRVQKQATWELLDFAASRAFAVADHQIAHVYVPDSSDLAAVKMLLEKTPGIERVLDADGIRAAGLDHPRSGELIAISAANTWFTYYYWEDDALCPPWAHEVDIHNKPGYDPVELFLDPKTCCIKARIAKRLLMRKLGFRQTIMDFIPFDASLVKGSHGRLPDSPEEGPLLITSDRSADLPDHMPAVDVKTFLLKQMFGQ